MNVVALVQARMLGGSRFGDGSKVLSYIGDRPMLNRVMERVARAKMVGEIVVVMPLDSEEDPLHEWCIAQGYKVARTQVTKLKGGAYDVLGAYAATAFLYRANPIVRVTADCPLIDPGVIDAVIHLYNHGGVDGKGCAYVSNNLERTFPHGLDVECFSNAALQQAASEATDEHDREHVTEYIRRHQDRPFTLANVRFPLETAKSIHQAILVSARLTVDYPEDLRLIEAIYEAFPRDHFITTADVVGLLEQRPELMAINERRAIEHYQSLGRHDPISAEAVAEMQRGAMKLVQ